MTPYYKDEYVTIYHADFREWVGPLHASAAIVDPPYGETGLKWDVWPEGWLHWLRVRMPAYSSLWCWGKLRLFMEHAAEFAEWKLAQDIVWEKPNGSSLHADRFRCVHEIAVHFYHHHAKWADVYKDPVIRHVEETRQRRAIKRQGKPAHWNDVSRVDCTYEYDGTRLARSVTYAAPVRHAIEHATPKPIEIQRDLISYSCPPGGKVVDIFCGSGSALEAAKSIGRRAIGFDSDLNACREAAARCSSVLPLPPS